MAEATTQPAQKVSEVVSKYRPCKALQPSSQASEVFVTSLDFDDSGELLVAACDDETIQLYNAKEGKHSKVLYSKKYGVHLAKFTHQSQSILYASTKVDDAIRLLSLHDSTYQRYFIGHTAAVVDIAVSPAKDRFVSCSLDGTVRLWEISSRYAQGKLNLTTPYLAAWDPSGHVIAIASPSTSTILLYDSEKFALPPFTLFNLQENEQVYTPETVGKNWTRLDFTNDGKYLVLGTEHYGHFVLDAFDGKLQAFLRRKTGGTGRRPPGSNKSLPRSQGDMSLTPDGRYVLGHSGEKSEIAVWDLGKMPDVGAQGNHYLEPMTILPGSNRRCPIVVCNPKYNMITSADRDVVMWLPNDADNDAE